MSRSAFAMTPKPIEPNDELILRNDVVGWLAFDEKDPYSRYVPQSGPEEETLQAGTTVTVRKVRDMSTYGRESPLPDLKPPFNKKFSIMKRDHIQASATFYDLGTPLPYDKMHHPLLSQTKGGPPSPTAHRVGDLVWTIKPVVLFGDGKLEVGEPLEVISDMANKSGGGKVFNIARGYYSVQKVTFRQETMTYN